MNKTAKERNIILKLVEYELSGSDSDFSADSAKDVTFQAPEAITDLSDDDWIDLESKKAKPTRKRKRFPEKWMENVVKARRSKCIGYKNKNKECPAKNPKSIDCSKCKFECSTKISEAVRMSICKEFWGFSNFIRHKELILKCVEVGLPKRRKRRYRRQRLTLKKSEDKGSQCAKCCLSCCICGFWLLEKFIRFLNHNAYTVVAIESINFCPAAGIAWNAMATNVLQVATINSVGDFILFLGEIVVAALSGLIGILMLKDREGLNFYMAPVILILIFSFFIAHIVLSLFEMVVDTLFLCVCEDKTINGRSGRWAQSNLAKLLGEDSLQRKRATNSSCRVMPINKQPFRITQLPSLESEQLAE